MLCNSGAQSRISARTCSVVNLDVTFYRNGVATDPYAIRAVDVYRCSVRDENLVAQFLFPDPGSSTYPAPAERVLDDNGQPIPGVFRLPFAIPKEFESDIYFDVWRFVSDCTGSGSEVEINDPTTWQCQSSRFWISPDGWYVDDGLEVMRFGFEPLDLKFRKPEKRVLEIGITPLPLYDFNNNLMMPIIPQLCATIKVGTENCECMFEEPAAIGLRMGSFRHSPFTIQYLLDTSRFLIGTYIYQITLLLPNGQTRVSEKFRFTIS